MAARDAVRPDAVTAVDDGPSPLPTALPALVVTLAESVRTVGLAPPPHDSPPPVPIYVSHCALLI